MKFILVDRLVSLTPREQIVTQKALTLAEEYLADHFPTFPVLPGVLMLEALVQSAAWLVRDALEFAPALVLLKEARNVTYKSFVAPGQVLTITADCKELGADQSVFAASGVVDGQAIVKARLTLRHLNLAERDPGMAEIDEQLRTRMRQRYRLLRVGAAA